VHLSGSNRILRGLGHTDFRTVLETLWQSGYRGDFAIECRIEEDAMEGLRRTRAYLEERVPPEARGH
jgi:sugar phosphate isomerase/epimerase